MEIINVSIPGLIKKEYRKSPKETISLSNFIVSYHNKRRRAQVYCTD